MNANSKEQLKSNLDWFDSTCELLKKSSKPTTQQLTALIGTERPNPKNEIRDSKLLDTFDKRFDGAFINPILNLKDSDKPLEAFGFWGNEFRIRIGDIANRFKTYRTQVNIYDGGTQIFFYPVPAEYDFSAISCMVRKELNEIENIINEEVNGVSFEFGKNLVLLRDGYHMYI
jgi:hypothetical protein